MFRVEFSVSARTLGQGEVLSFRVRVQDLLYICCDAEPHRESCATDRSIAYVRVGQWGEGRF